MFGEGWEFSDSEDANQEFLVRVVGDCPHDKVITVVLSE